VLSHSEAFGSVTADSAVSLDIYSIETIAIQNRDEEQ
jgi:hypothetical protein